MSDTIDIAKLRDLLAAATPGPWASTYYKDTNDWCIRANDMPLPGFSFDNAIIDEDGVSYSRDAALIVAAVNALPALLDQLEAVTKERDEALRLYKAKLHSPSECTFSRAVDELRADLEASRAREAALHGAITALAHGGEDQGCIVCGRGDIWDDPGSRHHETCVIGNALDKVQP